MKLARYRSRFKSAPSSIRWALPLGLPVLVIGLLSQPALAEHSESALSIVGVSSPGGSIAALDVNGVADGSVVSASANQSFTGLDGTSTTQTMTFSGSTITQSEFGRLHCYTSGSLQNSYYNASNPDYSDHNGNVVDPSGSPASLVALGFASFTDTLQYGGELQNGYKAKYIFHVDGTNSGTGALADLAVNVDANPGEAFFAGDLGHTAADWVTMDYAVNGIVPQKINVQFSNQVVFDAFTLAQGQDYSGTSDFYATLTLVGIGMVDGNGDPVYSGWTVSSESGTQYNQITPEPSSLLLLLGGAVYLALAAASDGNGPVGDSSFSQGNETVTRE